MRQVMSLHRECCDYVEAAFINGSWSLPWEGSVCLNVWAGESIRCLWLRMCFSGRDLAFELVNKAKLTLTNVGGIIYSGEAQTEQKEA